MDEPFIITVTYKGAERSFEAQLFTFSYTYAIRVTIEEVELNFERDDGGNFRAVAVNADDKRIHKLDAGLIQAVAEEIEELLA